MSRYIIGIDPGPLTSGLVVYHQPEGAVHGRVVLSNARACLLDIRAQLTTYALQAHHEGAELHVVIERTQAGPPSTAVVRTTEVVGRLMEMCEVRALAYWLYYRRQVLQALGCATKGNKDSLVRTALLEVHGGFRQVAIGTKRSPGPLYGVSSHAWQALGVVLAHIILPAFNTEDTTHDD